VLVITFARLNLERGQKSGGKLRYQAGAGRAASVIMTALAMVFGMLPMSLGIGEARAKCALGTGGHRRIGFLPPWPRYFFVPVVFSLLPPPNRFRNEIKTSRNGFGGNDLSTELT